MTEMFVSINFAGTYEDAKPNAPAEEMERSIEEAFKHEFDFDSVEWCNVEVTIE